MVQWASTSVSLVPVLLFCGAPNAAALALTSSSDGLRVLGGLAPDQRRNTGMHLAFVTDCGAHQRWMAMTLLHSAGRVGQDDPISWLRWGCDDSRKAEREVDERLLRQVYPQTELVDIDYTVAKLPDISWIKPFAFQGFLSDPGISNSTVVGMLDADFIFMSKLRLDDLAEHSIVSVDQAAPNSTTVSGMHGAVQHYLCCDNSGAPYIFSAAAWRKLLPEYCRLAGEAKGNWGDEQVAFSTAARKAGVTFSVFDHFMVSDLNGEGNEGWRWVDEHLAAPGSGACGVPGPVGEERLPTFLHVVRPWNPEGGVDTWQFSKYQVPPGFGHAQADGLLDCDMPLLAEPPVELVRSAGGDHRKRLASWGLCGIIHSINAMLLDFKRVKCSGTYNQNKALKIEKDWRNSLLPGADGGAAPGSAASLFVTRCALQLNCRHDD